MQSARLHALDNLRVVVIFLVVVLHAIISYMVAAPPWWYVLDPKRSLIFTILVLLIDVPIMQIMFFLSGYFALPSLERKGPSCFVKDKAIRIGLPWVFGALLLAPPTGYMIYYSRHMPMTLWRFWATDFWGPAFQQSVYWYLGVLMAFFVITALAWKNSRRFSAWKARNVAPTALGLGGAVAAMAAASLALAVRYPLDQWSNVYVFVYQPVRAPWYIGYFILGLVANRHGWFAEGGFTPKAGPWSAAAIATAALYLAARLVAPAMAPAAIALPLTVLFQHLFCFSALMASLAVFLAFGDGPQWFWRGQARASYGVYYLHPLILYPFLFVLVPWDGSIFLKAILGVVVGYGVSLAATNLVLLRLPGLSRVF